MTAHHGTQLTAAVAAVWNRKVKRHGKVKIVPIASASQLTLVDLMCALSSLQTDTILHLVKEVVKRPPQIRGDEVRGLGTLQMNVWHACNSTSWRWRLEGKQKS